MAVRSEPRRLRVAPRVEDRAGRRVGDMGRPNTTKTRSAESSVVALRKSAPSGCSRTRQAHVSRPVLTGSSSRRDHHPAASVPATRTPRSPSTSTTASSGGSNPRTGCDAQGSGIDSAPAARPSRSIEMATMANARDCIGTQSLSSRLAQTGPLRSVPQMRKHLLECDTVAASEQLVDRHLRARKQRSRALHPR